MCKDRWRLVSYLPGKDPLHCGFDPTDRLFGPFLMLPFGKRVVVAFDSDVPVISYRILGTGVSGRAALPVDRGMATAAASPKATPHSVYVTLTPMKSGTAELKIERNQKAEAKLNVHVYGRRTLLVACHLVTCAGRATLRTASDMSALIPYLNAIYEPQTNILFSLCQVGTVTLASGSGDQPTTVTNADEAVLLDNVYAPANINLFFVGECHHTSVESGDVHGFSLLNCQAAMIEDDTGCDWRDTTAHEIGHVLGLGSGLDHYFRGTGELMCENPPHGHRLRASDIDKFRSGLKRLDRQR